MIDEKFVEGLKDYILKNTKEYKVPRIYRIFDEDDLLIEHIKFKKMCLRKDCSECKYNKTNSMLDCFYNYLIDCE